MAAVATSSSVANIMQTSNFSHARVSVGAGRLEVTLTLLGGDKANRAEFDTSDAIDHTK